MKDGVKQRAPGVPGLWLDLYVVFLLAVAVRVVLALPQRQPHYFDSYYYYDVAENLQAGRGFVVDFIWNYLNEPQSVSHPSNLYWMPLSSMLAAVTMKVFGASYGAAQIPFILTSALLPSMAYALSWRLYGRRDYGWLAAILTAFAPFYLKYWACPDNFAPFAVCAALSLLTMGLLWSKRQARYALLTGLFMGGSHLARADGILLWLSFGIFLVMIVAVHRRAKVEDPFANGARGRGSMLADVFVWVGLALAGYLLIMGPWFWRNWALIGTPLSSAGIKTVFLRSYADLFSYSADLSWQSYLAWGVTDILRSKASAAVHNLAVVLGALQFHLVPFALVGLWQLRKRREYAPFYVYAATLYLSMVLVFTFPSTHASMLHSTAALLPFLFVASLPGIDSVVGWVARRRRTWHAPTARKVFRLGLTTLVVVISLFDYCQSVFLSLEPLELRPLWNQANTGYLTVSQWLEEHASDDPVVMVVDPPAYYYFTHRPAVVIPNEEVSGIVEIAQRYDVEYLILEYDHVLSLDAMYRARVSDPAFVLEHAFQDAGGNEIQIYQIRREA
jgi:hypothetical protein